MAVFLYHVVGDLTVGKPELEEFPETETVESAIKAIGESTEGGIAVWKKSSCVIENAELRQKRFVGILNSLDILGFLAKKGCLENQDMAMKTPVSDVVVPNTSLLKLVDPGTRLIDALEMMKQGVRRLLVPKSIGWRGMSKRFSILYNGKWLKNVDVSSSNNINSIANASRPSCYATIVRDKFCCLSREDVICFLIGCLGALAPLPLLSIASVGALNPDYCFVESSSPALEAIKKVPHDPSAVAIVESRLDGQYRIVGDISATKLWKCDYLASAWALENLSAGEFVMGVEDNMSSRLLSDVSAEAVARDTDPGDPEGSIRQRKFSSRSIGFFDNSSPSFGSGRCKYRGKSAALTCKVTSSLAAVMAQMLSHRTTHVWVTDVENEDALVGVVSYGDILAAVTRQTATNVPETIISEYRPED